MSRAEQHLDDSVAARAGVLRATAAMLSVAVATVIVSSLVVSSTASSLRPESVRATNSFEAGTVDLTDDDAGASLFGLGGMAPGRPVEQCIEVFYRGTIQPAVVRMRADVEGDLAELLDVRIERGVGGGFDDCAGFVELGPVWEGTLADLATETSALPLEVLDVPTSPMSATFRFIVEVRDDAAAMGRTAAADIIWESAVR
ncbi:MAG: hypothetical protein AAGA99_12460 [Actinomycetota bacterium]